jgi:chromosome segregation ATPase
MPSCSGNKKAPMTGGFSLLRRAKSGLRKLTKRSKPQTHAEELQMVNLRPKVASTRFGSMKKKLPYVVPGHVESMENIANLQASQLSELEQQVAKLEKANEKCNYDLVYKGVELNRVTGERNEMSHIHTKLEKVHKGTLKDLESAVAELAECEAGKASGSRRHVNRTLGALDTEDALNKAIEAEELLATAHEQLKALQDKYTSATQHAGAKSGKITELGVKLNAANAKVAALESNAREVMASAEKKSSRRRFAQNIAHGALSIMQKRASVKRQSAAQTEAALDKAQSNLNKLNEEYKKSVEINGTNTEQNMKLLELLDEANDKVIELQSAIGSAENRAGSTERKLASAERRNKLASSRAANLELESDVLKAQYAAAAERLENDTLKRSQELNHKNKLLAAARNQFAEVEANRKLKSKAAELVKNNMFSRRLTVGVQNPKSSKKSRQSNWVTSGGHLARG